MVSIRFDRGVSEALVQRLRNAIERATQSCPAACDVFVYPVSPGSILMVRLTVGQVVLPILFHEHELDPTRVLAVLKGELANAQY